MAEFKIEGMDELMSKLDALKDRKAVNRRARSAARKAMKIVELSAKMGAAYIDDPETREDIQKNIAIRAGKSNDLNMIRMRVGVIGGAAQNAKSNKDKLNALPGGMTTHWRYIEFGTSKMPATPFMRPALSQNIETVTSEFNKTFMRLIETAIKKGKIE